MVSALLVAILSQTPVQRTAILMSSRTGISVDRGQEVVAEIDDVLRQQGVPLVRVEEVHRILGELPECAAQRGCVSQRGSTLKVESVIAIQAAEALDELSLHLELISTQGAKVLAQDDVLLPSLAHAEPLKAALAAFAGRVREELARRPSAPALAADAPRVEQPTPSTRPAPSPPELTASEPELHRPAWVWAPGIAGVALAGAGVYFLAQAQSAADQLNGLKPPTLLDAQRVESDGVRNRTLGLVFSGVGVAAIAATVGLYKLEGSADEPVVSLVPSSNGWGIAVSERFR